MNKTFEAVTLDPPHRPDNTTEMTYRGHFVAPDGLQGWFRAALIVRPIFNKLATEHLAETKLMAETDRYEPTSTSTRRDIEDRSA